ncbi:MAG TPA: hypothetical protein VMB85_03315 [Bryobacteraceae bacterium]|nr:hypothetical protein [Bryobacteraceae bacterium]
MLIDWFTVVAQIVNFLVLVGLLKHFLYRRLLDAIDSREKRIAARLKEAEEKNRQAEQCVEQSRAAAERMEQQREQTLAEAREQAEAQHKELLEKARESVRALETKWHEDLDREKSAFLDEIRTRTAYEVLAIARRALADLASADLEQCAVQALLEKLPPLNGSHGEDELVVRSRSELDAASRQRIEETLHRRLGEKARVNFEHAPELAWGLELRVDGRRVGWNPESYIESLEENLRSALEQRAG